MWNLAWQVDWTKTLNVLAWGLENDPLVSPDVTSDDFDGSVLSPPPAAEASYVKLGLDVAGQLCGKITEVMSP